MLSVHPMATKRRQVARSVAMVMPLTGFEEVPMSPTMRDDTVTKKKPKTMMRTARRTRPPKVPGGGGEEERRRESRHRGARPRDTPRGGGAGWFRAADSAVAPPRRLATLPR